MPILSYWISVPLDDIEIFVGTCRFCDREDFEVKVKAWCVAYDHSFDQTRVVHHYLGACA